MSGELYADILRELGFHQIGNLGYRLHITVWWHPAVDRRLEVIVLTIGRSALIKATKVYYVQSVSTEGETWARDIGLLHDFLESSFPELRISFSHFRDVPAALAEREAKRRLSIEAPTLTTPTVEEIAQLQLQLQAKQHETSSLESLVALSTMRSDMLSGYVHQHSRSQKAQVEHLKQEIDRKRQQLGLFQHLQREYQRKGSAGVYSFAISSNLQTARDPLQFRDALQAVVKEIVDLHRYQVTQKLTGGRLNIRIAEADEPVMVWIEQWLGGALSPAQIQRLGPEFDLLRQASHEHVAVTPDEPIVVDGHVRHAEKHVAARFVSDVLQRVDKSDAAERVDSLSPDHVSSEAMPLTLGYRVDDSGKLLTKVAFPLNQMVHVYVSGTTGSGKSYLARVLVEEAAHHKKLNILVLDPRNQSVGLLVPEHRAKVLCNYDEFGLKKESAHGFRFDYYAPGLPYAAALPGSLSSLASGRSIVSLKGLDDQRRCAWAAKILNAVFEASNEKESEAPQLLLVVDEAQNFTRRRLDESAKEAAAQAERALDRVAREGRKFGIVLVLVSQSMKDFSHELASVRQMTTTKIFLRNTDREIAYAADVIGDGRLLPQLPTGTALVHNGNWGVVRIRVRPPYSKVFELGETEIRQLIGTDRAASKTLSTQTQELFAVIKQHASSPAQPLNMSRAAQLAGISSKRRFLELIGELESAGVIRTKTLMERGQPRVIELTGN